MIIDFFKLLFQILPQDLFFKAKFSLSQYLIFEKNTIKSIKVFHHDWLNSDSAISLFIE